ncbi:hypothetical protein HanPSC8_Chr16g0704761 [Helianthus annuus]|nr:hypothetical protein HanPSC8_Chr16g0704761 [Helianthus annuus]
MIISFSFNKGFKHCSHLHSEFVHHTVHKSTKIRMAGAENDVVVISDSEDSSAESEEFDDDETGPLIFIVPYTKCFVSWDKIIC